MVVDKKRHSSRCGDTDEDDKKILTREVVTHGTPDDRRDRFSFQGDLEETKRMITDIERAWREKTKAIQPEDVTQNSPERWRGRETVWAGPGSSGQNRRSLRPVRRKENLVDW